jgi:hypothetical protein
VKGDGLGEPINWKLFLSSFSRLAIVQAECHAASSFPANILKVLPRGKSFPPNIFKVLPRRFPPVFLKFCHVENLSRQIF